MAMETQQGVVPVPQHLELVVLKALEKRADHRYPHMADMALALQDPVQFVAMTGTGGTSSPR